MNGVSRRRVMYSIPGAQRLGTRGTRRNVLIDGPDQSTVTVNEVLAVSVLVVLSTPLMVSV